MPTHEELARFLREFARLAVADQDRFVLAMKHMVNDARAGGPFRPGLRIKKVQGQDDLFEMTWAPDGRATFQSGTSPHPGEMHIIWRRIGSHAILKNPQHGKGMLRLEIRRTAQGHLMRAIADGVRDLPARPIALAVHEAIR